MSQIEAADTEFFTVTYMKSDPKRKQRGPGNHLKFDLKNTNILVQMSEEIMRTNSGFPMEKLKKFSQGKTDDAEFFTSSYLKNGQKTKFGTPNSVEVEQVNWFRSGLKKPNQVQKAPIIDEEEEESVDSRDRIQKNYYSNFANSSDTDDSRSLIPRARSKSKLGYPISSHGRFKNQRSESNNFQKSARDDAIEAVTQLEPLRIDDPPFDFQKNPNLRISTVSIESEVDLPKFGEEKNLAKQLQSMHGNGFKKQFPHLPPPYVSMRGEFESDYQRDLRKRPSATRKKSFGSDYASDEPLLNFERERNVNADYPKYESLDRKRRSSRDDRDRRSRDRERDRDRNRRRRRERSYSDYETSSDEENDWNDNHSKTANKINTLNSQALNSALIVGNFITVKTEIERLQFCYNHCIDMDSENCFEILREQERSKDFCMLYIRYLKMVLASTSIVLQIIYGMMDISLVVERKEDANDDLTEEEQEIKMDNRRNFTFGLGVVGLFIALVNYVITAFE
ncbi:Oidioi.mRNA.OKI2018_I69.chr1.g1166.t1.cds [Oikopleura dioica]|uniref:Oidioi.mRNA.OKI2018_I69.chr1.g1166.t1.cds n=1 Tax=Oikopleura dioica TaxID=34765 RepID=A0ABN7SRC9_OIKDI|nr:Oidioi.mRNA.OKI2018_I69.chr1.g1166.t1.cds [Oikopleura dioica]